MWPIILKILIITGAAIGFLLLLIIVLLFIKVRLIFSHSGGCTVLYIKALFFKLNLLKDKKNKKDKNKKKRPEYSFKKIAGALPEILRTLRTTFCLKKFKLNAIIGAGSAAKTAIAVGAAYAGIYGALAVSKLAIEVESPEIKLTPAYNEEIFTGEIYFEIEGRTYKILKAAALIMKKLKAAEKKNDEK